ncbi:MAG: protease inhibitor I42 family protein [Bacteroidales bacterium]|nr:protease inhibitor I42 family protein [Bacteroidales bacterium]
MKKLMYVCIIMCLMGSCQSQKKLVSVDRETNEVDLKVGQSCEIAFSTNASTGFWWQWINSDEVTIVDSVGNRYHSNAPQGMVGASSMRYWKFQAKEKGTQTLKFVYARQNIKEAVRTREVTITVK